jgi:hypothetical protein
MVLKKITAILKKYNTIIQQEGVSVFIMKVVSFVRNNAQFRYKTYYIYENTLDGPQFSSRVEGTHLKIISEGNEFEKLVSEGYNLLPWKLEDLKYSTNKEAIAFCAFVKQDLAHITWVALTEKAQRYVDPFPLKIDWQTEACSGNSYTNPKYTRMGIYSYIYTEIFRFLKENGKTRDKFSIVKQNVSSTKALLKFDSKTIGEGDLLQILWWKFWKQRAFSKNKTSI